jgi:hypothetical protein
MIAELLYGGIRSGGKSTVFSQAGGNIALDRVSGRFVGSGVLGDGTRVTFATSQVDGNGAAGFYGAKAEDDPSLRGRDYGAWIVLPDGSQRGAIRRGSTVLPGGTLNTSTGIVRLDSRTITPSIDPSTASDGICVG